VNIYERLQDIAEKVSGGQPDAIKTDKGNVVAGRRLRKLLQEVRTQCVALRASILERRTK